MLYQLSYLPLPITQLDPILSNAFAIASILAATEHIILAHRDETTAGRSVEGIGMEGG